MTGTSESQVRWFVVAAFVCALLQVLLATGVGALVATTRTVAEQAGPPTTSPPFGAPDPAEPPVLPDGGGSGPPDPPTAQSAVPRPDRPVVRLRFDLADDLRSVSGSETVVFTPDLRVCELVFRLWPNKPETAEAGNELVVTRASVDGEVVTPVVESAGAPPGSTGTLLELPVEGCAEPGVPVTAELTFSLALGKDTPERVGWSAEESMAWWATAFPLLAWEHGVGWMTEPAVELFGEVAGSEAFELASMEVVADERLEVMGTGQLRGTTRAGQTGRVVHSFAAESVRDVAVVVGDLEVVEQEVGGTALHVAVPSSGSLVDADGWARAQALALAQVADYLGPYPYTDLWVTVVPDFPTGVEFPGAVLYGDVDPAEFVELVPHETAHMWLYGLVGNNQGRDPYLDEGLTSFVEAHVVGRGELTAAWPLPDEVEGYLGGSMSFWEEQDPTGQLYGAGVYAGGAVVFARARLAGPEEFDAALRSYVAGSAHRLATPADLAAAFESAPGAHAVLADAGAFAGDEGDP